ncbi:MAG: ABC transporter permease [Planctomycetota bacterium]|jgi:peptide/nickel transport system permease protein
MSENARGRTFRDIVITQFRRNRPAVISAWAVVGLFILAIITPMLAQSVPFVVWTPKDGTGFPWFRALFDQNVFPSGVDLFFNLSMIWVPVTLLVIKFARESARRIMKWSFALFVFTFFSIVGPDAVVESKAGEFVFFPQHVFRYSKPKINYRSVRAAKLERILAEEKIGTTKKKLARLGKELKKAEASLASPNASESKKADANAMAAAALGESKKAESKLADWEKRLAAAKKAEEDPANDYFMMLPPIGYHHDDNDADRVTNPPTWTGWGTGHFLGTDGTGRDVLARILYGTRVSITIGFIAVAIYCTIGVFLGSLMGYFGGRVDMLGMRMVEIMMCFPTFPFMLIIVAVFDTKSIFLIVVAIGLVGWTGVARLIRGQFFAERNLDYVSAARALGIPARRIVFKHILPNAIHPVFVSATFGVAAAILMESGLAFLGLGDPKVPSWGQILLEGRKSKEAWLIHSPGFAIFFTVTILNIVGEGLRDALDPKLRN